MRISDWSSDVCSSDLDRDLGLIGMRGVVNGDTLRHVEPLQLTRLLKHGLPAAPRIAATKAELRRDCNSQVRPPDRLFGKHPPSCKVANSPAPHPAIKNTGRHPRTETRQLGIEV